MAYEAELLGALTAGLHERLEAVAAAGGDPARLGSAADLARRMLAVVPAAHPWDEQIGPFYETAGLVRWLNVTKQALSDRVRRGRLLAVTTADGRVLYPARQFADRQLVQGLPETLAAFRATPVDGWAIAAWLTTPCSALGHSTPLDWLHTHTKPGPAVDAAHEAAARWAQ
jgi:hypothetical protein